MRTLLILVDGMRPDAIKDLPEAQNILNNAICDMRANTVMPSITLPCHVSLFQSVDPKRHGTMNNSFSHQINPVRGLCEVLSGNSKKCAFFYNWEELRDLSRPGSLAYSYYCGIDHFGGNTSNNMITDNAIEHLNCHYTDFAFLYLGAADIAGHNYGWMGKEYMDGLKNSWYNINRIVDTLPDDYVVIITSDHGGHEFDHGTDLPVDMNIPVIILGENLKADKKIENANIMDIAPTIVNLFGIDSDPEWEGKNLL